MIFETSNRLHRRRSLGRCLSLTLLTSFACGTLFATYAAGAPECPITDVPESEMKDAAKRIVDRIAIYTPDNAEERFKSVKAELADPALGNFEKEMMGAELRLIRETERTQEFEYNDEHVKLDLYPDLGVAIVVIPGTRQKRISYKFLPADEVAFYVKLKPRCEAGKGRLPLQAIDIRLRRDGPSPTLNDLSARYKDPPIQVLVQVLKREFAELKYRQELQYAGLKLGDKNLSENKERVSKLFESIVEKFETQEKNIEVLHNRIETIENELKQMKK